MLSAYQLPVVSNPAVNFLEAIATNEISANVDLKLPRGQNYCFIRAIGLVATENLDYELWVFSSATNLGGTIPTEKVIGIWQFQALSAVTPATPGYPVTPVGGVGDPLFHYYIDGNMIPYYDSDFASVVQTAANQGRAANLHCRLANRSAATKTAGAPGALQVTFYTAVQGMQA